MKRAEVFAVIALLLVSATSRAAEQHSVRIPVYVSGQCDNDTVGQRVGYQVREALRSSSSMELAKNYLSSVAQVLLVCLDPSEHDQGNVSQYSYVFTIINTKGRYDYYLSGGVGRCGSSRVHDCAMDIIAGLDSGLTKLIDQASQSEQGK